MTSGAGISLIVEGKRSVDVVSLFDVSGQDDVKQAVILCQLSGMRPTNQ
jgi:hypothetical protein